MSGVKFIGRVNHGLNDEKIIKHPTHLDVYLDETTSSFFWPQNETRADSTRATNPPDKNNFPCMPFHQDWTDKVIEAVTNNLQETGLIFFLLPCINLHPAPPPSPQQPVPVAFQEADGTVEKCKFMADDGFFSHLGKKK